MAERLKPLFAALLVLLASACDPPEKTLHESHYIFGTLVEIVIRNPDQTKAREAIVAVVELLRDQHREWHAWKPGGELYRINKAIADGSSIAVSDAMASMIEEAKRLSALSGGLFDPGIGAIVGAWGFHADEPPKGRKPPLDEIRALAARRPSISQITITDGVLSSSNRAVQLDFGAFAKGYGLDAGMAHLKTLGIKHAILNAGGDLNVIGEAYGRPWRVGIRHPVGWGVLGAVEAADGEAVYTSGNYERFLEVEGVRHSHILDPRDGMPVTHIASATVIHESGALADAAATALSVAGPEAWEEVAQAMGVERVLLVTEDGDILQSAGLGSSFALEPAD
ncbi:MAG: FAD:protein FMN transferase [Magnetovibrionaceae bacterium]